MTVPPRRRPSAPGISRAAAILHEVARTDGQTLSGIASNVGLARSTTSDVAGTLVEQGLLTRDAARQFHLGGRIEELASTWVGGTPVLRRFIRACDRRVELAGHTVLLLVPAGASLLCVDVRLGTRPLPQTPRPGTRLELMGTAPGLELLRAMPPEALLEMLERWRSFDALPQPFIDEAVSYATSNQSTQDSALEPAEPPSVAAVKELLPGTWIVVDVALPGTSRPGETQRVTAGLQALLADLVGDDR